VQRHLAHPLTRTALAVGVAVGGAAAAVPSSSAATAPCSRTVTPGTSISSALSALPTNAVLCLGDGTHRISGPLHPKAGQTIRGTRAAILSGSVKVTSWTVSGSRWQAKGYLPPAYTSAGACEDDVLRPCLKAESLFAGSRQLKRVMSESAVTSGTYYADYGANRLVIGQNPSGTAFELSRARTAIQSSATGVKLEGFTVQRFANLPQQGAVVVEGPSWRVQGLAVTQNHGVGVMIVNCSGAVVTASAISQNGQLGVSQTSSSGATISGNTITGNNTDGFWIADWESGGIKVTRSSTTISGNTITGNHGPGVWSDVANKGVTITGNQILGNDADGIRFEISYNGVITNNTVNDNARGFGSLRGGGTSLFASAGINVHTSSDVVVDGNRLKGNINGIGLQYRNRGTGPYGTYVLHNVKVRNNTVDMSTGAARSGLVASSGLSRVFDRSWSGVGFEGNTYVVDRTTADRFAWNGKFLPFSSWRSAGLDQTGTLRLPG
jgi:parallel beta-helix repeat protein